jgi:hypothetical protein
MGYKLTGAYIGTQKVRPKTIPQNWLLWYRPLQSDLKDASWNWKDGSWYSGTGTFSTVSGKTGARVTWQNSEWTYLSTQHIITSITHETSPVTLCWWICYNTVVVFDNTWHGLMSSSNGGWKWQTIWTRPAQSNKPYAAVQWATIELNSSAPSTNTWYFWTVTSDWTTVKAYENWVLKNSASVASFTAWWAWKLWCAMVNSWNSVNAWTDGWVRHCAVYNRELTADEILRYYNLTA